MLITQVRLDDETVSVETTTNGAKVLCKKMPAMLLAAFDRSHRPPKPPAVEVDVLGGGKDWIEDPEDPAYLAKLDAFEAKRAMDFMELAFDFVELLDESEEQVQERAQRLERYGIERTERNRVESFALEDPTVDIQILTQALMRLSTVTAQEVRKAEESFRPEVDGHAGDEIINAQEPLDLRPGTPVPVPGVPAAESGTS